MAYKIIILLSKGTVH